MSDDDQTQPVPGGHDAFRPQRSDGDEPTEMTQPFSVGSLGSAGAEGAESPEVPSSQRSETPPAWTPGVTAPGTTPLPAAPPPGAPQALGASAVGAPAWGTWTESTGIEDRERTRRGPSGWLWPAVAALAMVVGLLGGVAGSAIYQSANEDDSVAGTVDSGLDGVDTVALPPLGADDASIAGVAERLLPSTVQISAEYDGEADGATGSGFVLDREGHVITNNHVVADAATDDGPIQVVDQDGNRYDATIVGRSTVYDLAVLYAPDADLEPAALGYSQRLRVGEGVVAIGSPLGLSSTVTAGIVSALQRPVTTGDTDDDSSYINAVQTDAAINPGNSGGPLVNLLGQVVGVNSAIATNGGASGDAGNIGVGFAIPVEQVRTTADQILKTGEARYPVIGAEIQTGDRSGAGAEVNKVNNGSPAEDGGLEVGDVITGIDGDRVTSGVGLIVSIRSHQPGEVVEFVVDRDGDEEQVSITLGSEVG